MEHEVREKHPAVQTAKIFLVVILIILTLIGNISFIAIFARFKVFQNFPNILFANSALVGLINALTGAPLFLIAQIFPLWLKGRMWATIASAQHLEFTLLNLVSMSALMLDRFLVLFMDLRYFTWKTKKRAIMAVAFMWFLCTTVTALASLRLQLIDINLDNVPLGKARGMIFEIRKSVIKSVIALFTIAATVLGTLVSYAINQKKKRGKVLNLTALQEEARLQSVVKATKTVAMAIVTFYVCYIPAIAFGISGRVDNQGWFPFAAGYLTFIASVFNPAIYVLRNRRNRFAVRQLLKDPCGTSTFQEKPVNPRGEEKREEDSTKELQINEPRVLTDLHKNTESPEHKPKMLEPNRMEQLSSASATDVVIFGSKDGNMEEQMKKWVGNLNVEESLSTRLCENSIREARLSSAKRKLFESCRVGALPGSEAEICSISSQDENDEKQGNIMKEI